MPPTTDNLLESDSEATSYYFPISDTAKEQTAARGFSYLGYVGFAS